VHYIICCVRSQYSNRFSSATNGLRHQWGRQNGEYGLYKYVCNKVKWAFSLLLILGLNYCLTCCQANIQCRWADFITMSLASLRVHVTVQRSSGLGGGRGANNSRRKKKTACYEMLRRTSRVLVNTVMNLRVAWKAEKFLTC